MPLHGTTDELKN